MEFGFTKEQEALRKEIHDFFKNELPVDFRANEVRGDKDSAQEEFSVELQNKAVKKGYPTAGWPKKYGGLGFDAIEQGIVSEEMAYWGVDWAAFGGYWLMGPVIMTVGTEEQKARFVPPIARGELICFEAFTEPDAGSDEANVKLRAVSNGDDFILNGQKTFIGGVKKPDWLFTLTRTADTTPKHRGLSLFLVPGDAPGISYRPLEIMNGYRTEEIFFENVRVSNKNLLGELNRGFYAAMATFEFERAAIALDARRGLESVVEFCRTKKRNGKSLIKDHKVRENLARMAIHQQIQSLIGWHGAWRSTQRGKLGPQKYDLASFIRKDLLPGTANDLMGMFDMYGQLAADDEHAQYDGSVGTRWEASRVLHPAGTPEILKVVIANRGLGLPRIPAKFNAMIAAELGKE